MPKFTKSESELSTYLDKWFYFLNNLDALEQISEIFNDDKDIKNAFKKAEFINMTKEEQNVYLASLKEYRDWYAVLSTAEDKGYAKAKDELQRIKKEKWKVEKEKEKVQKEKEKAEREKEKIQKEKEKAENEKEKALKREEKALQKTKKAILKFYKLGVSIKELSKNFEMSEDEVKEIIKMN
jgi:small-conductance mechanosensitive channel